MVALLPKSQTKLTVMYREHQELLEHLAPEEKPRVICCAAKLINYFGRWQSWKKSIYPTEWIYQPLQAIRHDLLKEHSIHVIREAILLLERLDFLERRKNERGVNYRNGQDKTHQYYLHRDRIQQALKNVFGGSEAKSLDDTREFDSETSKLKPEIREFNVETHTQIPSIDSCPNSCSLSEEREKLDFLAKEEEEENSQEEDVIPTSFAPSQDSTNLLQQSKDSGLDKCSAPLQLKKNQNDLPTPEGWNDFYPQLLEYARREGKSSPAGWTSKVSHQILQELAAGRPHCLWSDFQNGFLLGASEFGGQREWLNPETHEPWPYFQEALIEHFQHEMAEHTKEVKSRFNVAGKVTAILAQPKKAALYWTELKREIIKYRLRWERDRNLGISQPYLPPYYSDRTEPSLQEAAQAMGELKGDANQLESAAATNSLPPTQADLPLMPPQPPQQQACLPLREEEDSLAEPASVEEKPSMQELQERLNLRTYAAVTRILVGANPQWGYVIVENLVLPAAGEAPSPEYLRSLLANPITAPKVRRLIEANPSWGFFIDQEGQLWEF